MTRSSRKLPPGPSSVTMRLRSASPAKTRSDVVVVGLLSRDKAVELAPGSEDVGAAYGRRLRPLLATLGA
ncbi:MAG: hypothetical protein WAW88_15580, partial [Nocardioides sp.]